MSAVDLPPFFATLFDACKPVREYDRFLAARGTPAPAQTVPVPAIDAFLMQQICAGYPAAPVVVDLAADATFGASTIFWSVQPQCTQIIAANSHGAEWRPLVSSAQSALELDAKTMTVQTYDRTEGLEWTLLKQAVPRGAPVFVHLAFGKEQVVYCENWLESVFTHFHDAIVFIAPLGLVGECDLLAAALRFCSGSGRHRLTAPRELSGFFTLSRLGIVSRMDNPCLAPVLARIAQMFEGNFQFLSLVEWASAANVRLRSLAQEHNGRELADSKGAIEPRTYQHLVLQIQGVIRNVATPGARVLVVSKGDESLLRCDSCQCEHFPQGEDGQYAGHYPADSEEAIAHLEELRAKGANLLVIPAPAGWWLEHYAEWREHLETHYTVAARHEGICVVFALSALPGGTKIDYEGLVDAIRAMVRKRLPREATVVVVNKGDCNLLNLEGRRAWHFPRTEDGEYAGYYPLTDADAIDHLERLRRQGGEYLLLPETAFWWMEHYGGFRAHLESNYRQLISDAKTCLIFDLRSTQRKVRRSWWRWRW
jgi:hypothetical protein